MSAGVLAPDADALAASAASPPMFPLSVHGTLPATDVELAVFLLIGLLGGAHCLGMCGPLVTLYADRLAASGDARADLLTLREVRQHALFNLGRTVSYAAIGGLFGLAGALVYDAAGTVAAVGSLVRAVTGVAVGLFILAVGARYALGRQGGHAPATGAFSWVYERLTGRVDRWVDGPGMVGLGLLHGLLPCPLLYPAFLYAFARGSPTAGVVALGTLGLGTVPTLLLYGTVVQSVSATRRARLHRALGVAFLLLAWIPLGHGLALLGLPVPHVAIPIYQPL